MADTPPVAVFDLDGTLVDTAKDLIATLNAVAGPHGLPHVSLADGRMMVGHGVRVLIERAFARAGQPVPGEPDALFRAYLAHYMHHMADHSRPFLGAVEALTALAADGWRLAVCTNKLEAYARRLLDVLDLSRFFVTVTGQDTFGFRKPDPRHLTETIRLAGGNPRRAVMIGDSATDVDTAVAAKVPVIVVSFGYSDVPVTDLKATAVLHEYRGLPSLIRTLMGQPAENARPASTIH